MKGIQMESFLLSSSDSSTASIATEQDKEDRLPSCCQHTISRAEALFSEDKILESARLLRKINGTLSVPHERIVRLAEECEQSIDDLIGLPTSDSGWTKQGETHGSLPTLIYNKMDEEMRLTCRIETLIESSLLVPLLSVLNETDLFDTWIPSYRVPRLGIRKSKKLEQAGRANQIIQLVFDAPWPMKAREAIIHAVAVDEIDTKGYIFVHLNTVDEGPTIPPAEYDAVRVDFDGAILFRACPADHELLLRATTKRADPLILVSFKMLLDSHMSAVPQTLINFVTKTVIGQMWSMFLHVAEGVKGGTREKHKMAILEKGELYRWIQQRTDHMLDSMTKTRLEVCSLEEHRFIAYLQG